MYIFITVSTIILIPLAIKTFIALKNEFIKDLPKIKEKLKNEN